MIVIAVSAIVTTIFVIAWARRYVRERKLFSGRQVGWEAFAESLAGQGWNGEAVRAVFDALTEEGVDAGLARAHDTLDLLGVVDEDLEDFVAIACRHAGVSIDDFEVLVDPKRGKLPLKTVENLVRVLTSLQDQRRAVQES